jgi:hypothetical protein
LAESVIAKSLVAKRADRIVLIAIASAAPTKKGDPKAALSHRLD